jgi:hypothetical protein
MECMLQLRAVGEKVCQANRNDNLCHSVSYLFFVQVMRECVRRIEMYVTLQVIQYYHLREYDNVRCIGMCVTVQLNLIRIEMYVTLDKQVCHNVSCVIVREFK